MRRPPVTLSSRDQSAVLRILRFHISIMDAFEKMAVRDADGDRREFMTVNLAYQRKFTARLIARFSA